MGQPDDNFARRERALAPEVRAKYFATWETRLRDDDTYVVWAWAFGGFGAHRFYLGQACRALMHLCLFPAGLLLLIAGFVALPTEMLADGCTIALTSLSFSTTSMGPPMPPSPNHPERSGSKIGAISP